MINAMVRKQDPNNYSDADCWYEVSQLKAFKVDSELFFGIFPVFFLLLTFIEDTYESQDRDGDGEYLIFLVFQMFTWAVRNIST